MLSHVADKPLLFKPGAKYAYSNSDNIIAALMVEQATGKPFSQELLTPCGRAARARTDDVAE